MFDQNNDLLKVLLFYSHFQSLQYYKQDKKQDENELFGTTVVRALRPGEPELGEYTDNDKKGEKKADA